MTLAAPQGRFTPDDVLRLEDEGVYELVDRLGGNAERLNESDTLTADPVLPGFSVIVSELFPPVGNAKP